MSPFHEGSFPIEIGHDLNPDFSHAMGALTKQGETLNLRAGAVGLVHGVSKILPLAVLGGAIWLAAHLMREKKRRF